MSRTGSAVGIDWGVRETATTMTVNAQGEVRESVDLDIPFGAYERKYEKSLAEAQRRMARRHQKGKRCSEQSRGYKKALRQLFAISLACEMIIVVSGLCVALQRRTISARSSLV